ncbi:MAG: hypothetical protein J0I41_07345 [Filimonas sp.]|nr:hypothetical protein [Filimonas sp.]
MEDKQLNEQESLQLITEMIQKAKGGFHESGSSAILWGSAVGIAGIVSFIESYWNFYIGFDIWFILFAAIIPQIFISIKENKNKKAISREERNMDAVWMVYALSIIAVTFYTNIMPWASERLASGEGTQYWKRTVATGAVERMRLFVPSASSVYLIIYAIPTLTVGIARRFKPMLIGGFVCYALFFASCFTSFTWDILFNGIGGICNWLIPGLILRKRFLKQKAGNV